MYSNLVLYRNELKNKNVARYKLIGIVSELILSRKIFKKNSDITEFLKKVFNIEYKEYVIRSRTLIIAHISRNIVKLDSFENKKVLLEFINCKIEELKEEEDVKGEKNQFDGWLS